MATKDDVNQRVVQKDQLAEVGEAIREGPQQSLFRARCNLRKTPKASNKEKRVTSFFIHLKKSGYWWSEYHNIDMIMRWIIFKISLIFLWVFCQK